MKQDSLSDGPVRSRALAGLREALSRHRPHVAINDQGYAADFRDTLLPLVAAEDFETDLRAGDGNELETKFRAAHSSSALAVNCFAPFRRRIADLALPMGRAFQDLQFERKCPTGLRGGRAPNLDVLLSGPTGVVGVESKLTGFLGRHRAAFSPAYADQIRDERRDQGYFREMHRLTDAPDSHVWLDAAHLIKHAFGMARTFRDRPMTRLYLYWEPANPECSMEFASWNSRHGIRVAWAGDRGLRPTRRGFTADVHGDELPGPLGRMARRRAGVAVGASRSSGGPLPDPHIMVVGRTAAGKRERPHSSGPPRGGAGARTACKVP